MKFGEFLRERYIYDSTTERMIRRRVIYRRVSWDKKEVEAWWVEIRAKIYDEYIWYFLWTWNGVCSVSWGQSKDDEYDVYFGVCCVSWGQSKDDDI